MKIEIRKIEKGLICNYAPPAWVEVHERKRGVRYDCYYPDDVNPNKTCHYFCFERSDSDNLSDFALEVVKRNVSGLLIDVEEIDFILN